MAYVINTNDCVACGACADACPTGAVLVTDGAYSIDQEKCVSCGACKEACPSGAVLEQ